MSGIKLKSAHIIIGTGGKLSACTWVTTNTPFGYYGEYVGSESGNVRYYNSSTGRFITEDPAHDRLNWYVYAGSNPVMMIDPSGLYAVILLNSASV